MNTDEIVKALETELEAIDTAITALTGNRSNRGRGRRRHLSAEARKRISQAQKKRWAERKKKKVLVPAADFERKKKKGKE